MMIRRYGSNDDESKSLLDTAYCEHYSGDSQNNLLSDEPSASASGGGSYNNPNTTTTRRKQHKQKRSNASSSCIKIFVNIILLPLLLLITILSLYYSYKLQHELTSLSSQLSTATSTISTLSTTANLHTNQLYSINATLVNHSSVIARFAYSVSNSDVLQTLHQIENDELEREERLTNDMLQTKTDITNVLNATKKDIDDTVRNATNQINHQVSSVQSTLSHYIRTTQDQFSTENSFMIYQLAGTFTLLGCLISMWHMTNHIRNFHQPFVQRKILAILWMCPIYSITSWLSLVIPRMEGYLGIFKDMYEAYVIYQFLSFCIAVLGKGDRNTVVELLAKHADHLSPPIRCSFGCCKKHLGAGIQCEDEKKQLADDVLLQCQVCAMQFVFLRPLLTAALFILKKVQYYGPMFGPGSPFDHHYDNSGEDGVDDMDSGMGGSGGGGGGLVDYRSPQFYIVILQNVSVFVAFSGLINFYHAVSEDLSWCKPFPKFLCIKGVVFMTFWQGVTISFLASATDLLRSGGEVVSTGDGNDSDQVETWAKQAQNFLICLEMLGFAIAHFYCFPVEEWQEGYRPVEDTSKFGDNMALGDFLHDLKLIMQHKKEKKRIAKEKFGGKPTSDDSISTVLEEDEEMGMSHTDSTGGLQSLLDNVEDLLENGRSDAAVDTGGATEAETAMNTTVDDAEEQKTNCATFDASEQNEVSDYSAVEERAASKDTDISAIITPRTRNSIQQQLAAMNAPSELREATALLLQSTLLDEDTARLLTRDILDQTSIEEEDAKEAAVKDETEDQKQRHIKAEARAKKMKAFSDRRETGQEDDEAAASNITKRRHRMRRKKKKVQTADDEDTKAVKEESESIPIKEKEQETNAVGDGVQPDNTAAVAAAVAASESTALLRPSESALSVSSSNDGILQPSIFTMHSPPSTHGSVNSEMSEIE